jgi:hypothetical protein
MYADEQVEPFTIHDVRCACAVCGAHVIAWEGHELSGWCGVCGSYELRTIPLPAESHHGGLGNHFVLGQQPVLHGEKAGGRAA